MMMFKQFKRPIGHYLGAGLFAACVVALVLLLQQNDSAPEPASSRVIDAVFPIPSHMPYRSSPPAADDNPNIALTKRLANPLERARNLRRVYDKYKTSSDPAERNTAYRAWSACFPTFVAPQGQPVTLEIATRALPQNAPNSAERIDAYRALMGRCKDFFDMPHDAVIAQTQQQNRAWLSGDLRAPGERAAKYLADGKTQEAASTAHAIIASQDPFAIYSLREFMGTYLALPGNAQSGRAPGQQDVRALAFYIVPCELGMECGPDSLTALQLCAQTGECSGTVAERYLHAFSAQVDRTVLENESRRIADAIKAGDYHALGL